MTIHHTPLADLNLLNNTKPQSPALSAKEREPGIKVEEHSLSPVLCIITPVINLKSAERLDQNTSITNKIYNSKV